MTNSSPRQIPSLAAGARRAARGGMSFVEVLVAIAIASIFLVGIVGALSALLESASRAERIGEATRQARLALDKMSDDLAQASIVPPGVARLVGVDAPQPTGDRYDNDGDGLVDEEAFDGRNDDGGPVVQNHVVVGVAVVPVIERPRQTAIAEIGDTGVDEDTVFQLDRLAFTMATEEITYFVGTYDGRPNTLIRSARNLAIGTTSEAPVAYDVISFNALYFDPNWLLNATGHPWATSWDSLNPPGLINLAFFPPTIHLSVTVYAGDIPLADALASGEPIFHATLQTQATIEAALPLYRLLF